MKTPTLATFKTLCAALILASVSLLDSPAASMFWDPNGTGAAGSSTWNTSSAKWATNSTLTASTVAYVNGSFAEFAAGSGGINAMTITVSGSPTCAGIATGLTGETVTNLTFSGSGSIGIVTNGGTPVNGGLVQGFFCGPSSSGGLTFYVSLTGGGGIQQSSSGALYLYTNNTYSGGTVLTGGQLVYFNNNDSFGTGPIYVNGSAGALVNSATTPITLGNNVTFPTANYNLNLAAASTAGTTYTGNFTLPSSGITTLFTGGSPAGEIVKISGVISGSSGLTVADNGIMELAGVNTFSGALTITSPVAVVITNAGSLGSGSFSQKITNNSIFVYNSSASQTLSGVISGTGNLTQKGSGTLTLSAANTYSGGTTNAGGILSVNTLADSGTSAIGTSGTFTFAGGTLKYTGAGAATTSRSVKGLGGTTSTIDLANGNLTLSAGITGTAAFTVGKSSGSTLTLSGSADDAFLAMNVNGGTVVLNKTSGPSAHGLGGSSSIASGATLKLGGSGGDQIYTGVTITDNGIFDMAGTSEGFSMLLGSGLVTNSSATTGTLTLGENNTGGVFSGVISDGASGKVALTKTGTGVLILEGTNVYTGNTAVNGGTLALTNSGSLANGTSITLAAGTTLDVSGLTATTYTLGSSASLTVGGASASTIIGNTVVDFGSSPVTLNFDGAHTPLTVSQGALNLNGNTFTVNNTGSPLGVSTYTLVSVTGGTITSSGSPSVSVTGSGLAAGNTASLAISGGTVLLVVKATPVFTGLTSPSVAYGTNWIILTGTISSGLLYPTNGETVTASINGHAVAGSVTNSIGDFSITYNDASLATDDAGSYTITYSYGGDDSLSSGTSSSASLTVTNALSTNNVTASTKTALPGVPVVFTSTLSILAPSVAVPTNLVSFLIDSTNAAGSAYPVSGMASFTNSMLSHGYHIIEADYAGDTNALGTTNIAGSTNTVTVLINTPPVAGALTNSRPQNVSLHIAISNIIAAAFDADGDAITLASVGATSTNGATITTNGAFLTYTPPATNGNVTDTFNYVVQDSFSATATNTITVTVMSEANGPSVNITGLSTLANGTTQIGFAGIPNYTYLVEGTTNLTTPITWTILGTNVAGTNGLFQFNDLDSTNYPTRYYRTAVPPGY